jgi:hypothetical protein
MEEMKKLLLAVLYGLASIANAQTVVWPVIAWGWAPVAAPTGATVTYNLYGSTSATGPWSKISVTGTSYVAQGVAVGTYYYYLTYVLNGVESDPSEIDSITVTVP